jgi:hypothetical protein
MWRLFVFGILLLQSLLSIINQSRLHTILVCQTVLGFFSLSFSPQKKGSLSITIYHQRYARSSSNENCILKSPT